MDDDRRAGRAGGPLLPGTAARSRRQRCGHGRRSVLDAEPAGISGLDRSFCTGGDFLALRFAGLHLRRGGYAAADLFSVGTASRAASGGDFRRAGRCGANRLQARRQHPTPGAGRRAEVFVRQKPERGVSRIAILGGGSWGTALGIVLSRAHRKHEISLWVHDLALAETIARDRENRTYLPGHLLARDVRVTAHVREAVAGAQILIGAVPTAHARAVYSAVAAYVSPEGILVSASKGLEPDTHKRMSEVIGAVLAPKFAPRLAVLSA